MCVFNLCVFNVCVELCACLICVCVKLYVVILCAYERERKRDGGGVRERYFTWP